LCRIIPSESGLDEPSPIAKMPLMKVRGISILQNGSNWIASSGTTEPFELPLLSLPR
jgi:hypothetical protein